MAVAKRFMANSSGQDRELKGHELGGLIGICMLQSKSNFLSVVEG